MKAAWIMRGAIGAAFVLSVLGLQNPNTLIGGIVAGLLAFAILVWGLNPEAHTSNRSIRRELEALLNAQQAQATQWPNRGD